MTIGAGVRISEIHARITLHVPGLTSAILIAGSLGPSHDFSLEAPHVTRMLDDIELAASPLPRSAPLTVPQRSNMFLQNGWITKPGCQGSLNA